MLNDVFMEYMIKKKKDSKDIIFIVLLSVAAILLSLIILFFMIAFMGGGQNQLGSMFSSIGLLLVAGVWYGFYILVGMRSIEFEYILTNSEMDIDKIMSKKSRKRIASFDFKSAEIVACIEDSMHNAEYKNRKDIEVIDARGDSAYSKIYFADVKIDDKPKRILFQPTSKMLDSIKKFNPRNVFIYEG